MGDVRPLSAEERRDIELRARAGVFPTNLRPAFARYEATVRAVEAERDAALARVERLRAALVTICETTCSWFEVEDIATRALYADDEAVSR